MIALVPSWLRRAGLVVLTVVYAVPLLWMVLTSFKSDADVLARPNAVLFTPTLDNLGTVIGAAAVSIGTSARIAVAVTVVVLVVAVPAAYALARPATRRWGAVAGLLLGVLLVLQMVPQPMAVIPLYSILADWRLIGTLSGLILVDVALLVPFAILLLRPFVLSVPPELYESAQIDGAGHGRTFLRVVVPLLVNGIATVAAITFILAWGEFIFATTLITDSAGLPVSGLLAAQISLYSVSWNRLMGLALLTSLPLLLVFLVAKRRLVEGLSVGAIK